MHGSEQDIRQPNNRHHEDGNGYKEGSEECKGSGKETVVRRVVFSVGSMDSPHEEHSEQYGGLELPSRMDSGEGGGSDEIEEDREDITVSHDAHRQHQEEDGASVQERECEGKV